MQPKGTGRISQLAVKETLLIDRAQATQSFGRSRSEARKSFIRRAGEHLPKPLSAERLSGRFWIAQSYNCFKLSLFRPKFWALAHSNQLGSRVFFLASKRLHQGGLKPARTAPGRNLEILKAQTKPKILGGKGDQPILDPNPLSNLSNSAPELAGFGVRFLPPKIIFTEIKKFYKIRDQHSRLFSPKQGSRSQGLNSKMVRRPPDRGAKHAGRL